MTDTWPDGQEKRYRYRILSAGTPRTEWRDTEAKAMRDAVRHNLSSWDASKREHYLAVPVEMERELRPRFVLSTRAAPRPWTRDDVATLLRMAPTMAWPSDIAKALGRTEAAVVAQGRRLKVELRTKSRDERQLHEALKDYAPKRARRVPKELRGRAQF